MSTDFRHPGHAALQRYVLGESSADERLALEEHLARCVECDALVDADRQLDAWLVESAPGPVPRGTQRASFDRLWAAVDAETSTHGSAAPGSVTATDGGHPWGRWVALAAAALLVVTLRAVFMTADGGDPGTDGTSGTMAGGAEFEADLPLPDNATAPPELLPRIGPPDHSDLAVGGGLSTNPPDSPAPTEAVESGLDPARLARARAEVAAVLVQVDEDFPADDRAFRLGCDDRLDVLRREGWPVTHLVRDHALDRAAVARLPSLRYAALDPSSAPTLVRVLDRPQDVDDALWTLFERAESTPLPSAVARALGRVLDDGRGRSMDERSTLALQLLRRPGGEAERLALTERAVGRLRTLQPGDPDAERLLWLIADLPAAGAVSFLAVMAKSDALRAAAEAAFFVRARSEPFATGLALGALALDDRRREIAVDWARQAGLASAAPGLLAALQADPEDGTLRDAVAQLAGAGEAAALFTLWREQRHRRAGHDLQVLLVSLLDREAEARVRLGASLQPRALDDLVVLVEQLAPGRRGDALLAFISSEPSGTGTRPRERDSARAGAMSTLARLGDAEDADTLLAWIDSADHEERSLLALAWATAAVLDGETSLGLWTGQGRDASVLASASAHDMAWPQAKNRPPMRLLRDLDRSLRRPARPGPPEAGE